MLGDTCSASSSCLGPTCPPAPWPPPALLLYCFSQFLSICFTFLPLSSYGSLISAPSPGWCQALQCPGPRGRCRLGCAGLGRTLCGWAFTIPRLAALSLQPLTCGMSTGVLISGPLWGGRASHSACTSQGSLRFMPMSGVTATVILPLCSQTWVCSPEKGQIPSPVLPACLCPLGDTCAVSLSNSHSPLVCHDH